MSSVGALQSGQALRGAGFRCGVAAESRTSPTSTTHRPVVAVRPGAPRSFAPSPQARNSLPVSPGFLCADAGAWPTIGGVTSSYEFPALPLPRPRVTDADRDRALAVLQQGAAEGRLSQETFLRRLDLALAARHAEELATLTADLDSPGRVSLAVFGAVGAVSGFAEGLRRAWWAERLPKLLLPSPLPGAALRIGRDPANGLRLSHDTVSRVHAELVHQAGVWVLRDLGSTNGTTVNGRRVVGAAVVRDGDHVSFGRMTYRLAAP